jgi:hypothetical protein
MVREVEESGETSVRSGWNMGWSRLLSLLGIDLAIGIPAALVAMLLLGIGLSPLILLLLKKQALNIVAGIATAFLMLVVIAVLIVFGTVVSLLGELAHRQAVLEGKGVVDSIRDAYRFGMENARHVIVVWLILLVLGFVLAAVMAPFGIFGFGIGAGFVASILHATDSGLLALLAAAFFGIPALLVISFLGGLYEAFRSAVWTLAYRDLQG